MIRFGLTDPREACANAEEAAWAFVHDAIAHPLMALTAWSACAVRFHDWTSARARATQRSTRCGRRVYEVPCLRKRGAARAVHTRRCHEGHPAALLQRLRPPLVYRRKVPSSTPLP